jgi:hypothetical protein
MTASENELDQAAQVALEAVKLEHFTAEPSTIGPFGESKLSWGVTVPRESDVSVDFDIDGTPVAASGELFVAPESSTSYELRARARKYSRVIGTVAVQVDLGACIALSAEPALLVTAAIRSNISSDKTLRFRSPADPVVAIRDDRMIITLRLTKSVKGAPDPDVDIDASYTLGVIPAPSYGPHHHIGDVDPLYQPFHQLSAENKDIAVDISFPWYAWLIPGAMIGLPIAISGGEADGYKSTSGMIDDIVSLLDGWFSQANVQRPQMDKHDAGFDVNPQGEQRFWINFCPFPRPGPVVGS